MADSKSDPQAHKMDPSHPAHDPAKKLAETQQHGTLSPEHFEAESAIINLDINYSVFNMGGNKPPEK